MICTDTETFNQTSCSNKLLTDSLMFIGWADGQVNCYRFIVNHYENLVRWQNGFWLIEKSFFL